MGQRTAEGKDGRNERKKARTQKRKGGLAT